MIAACLFDLDGVIVDTAKYHYLAWKKMAHGLGFDFTEKDNERLKGVSRMRSLEILLEIGNLNLSEEEKLKLAEQKNNDYLVYIHQMTPAEILPGVEAFLDELKANHIPFALGSASKNAPLILKQIGFDKKFDAIADGNVVATAKPDPEVFLVGAEMLNVNPKDCVVFEDAEAGIEAACAAGMKSIGIGSMEQLGKATAVVPNMEGFTLEKLRKLINE